MLRGVMVNKDVTHPRMKRMIKEPRIILLDCSLEYKKGESQVTHTNTVIHTLIHTNTHMHTYTHIYSLTHSCISGVSIYVMCCCVIQTDIEISKEEDFARILQMEEEYIQQICEDVIRLKPDLVFTEKGISGPSPHTHTQNE